MANEVIRIHEQFYSMHVFPARSPVYAGSDEMGVGGRLDGTCRWQTLVSRAHPHLSSDRQRGRGHARAGGADDRCGLTFVSPQGQVQEEES
jgi:hypothetical protein